MDKSEGVNSELADLEAPKLIFIEVRVTKPGD
jgi:hypothetical protein